MVYIHEARGPVTQYYSLKSLIKLHVQNALLYGHLPLIIEILVEEVYLVLRIYVFTQQHTNKPRLDNEVVMLSLLQYVLQVNKGEVVDYVQLHGTRLSRETHNNHSLLTCFLILVEVVHIHTYTLKNTSCAKN